MFQSILRMSETMPSKGESSDALRLKVGATPDPLWCSLKDSFARENKMPPVNINDGGNERPTGPDRTNKRSLLYSP